MRRMTHVQLALALAAVLALGAVGCANLQLFNRETVQYYPDPNETGQVDALEQRVGEIEARQAQRAPLGYAAPIGGTR